MVQQPILFGEELRRRRLAAGLSLTGLAQRVHYSKGQLSKVERGIKLPSREMAVLCDAALDAGGTLVTLVHKSTPVPEISEVVPGTGDEAWLMQLCTGGQSWFEPVSRRQAIITSAAAIPFISLGGAAVPTRIDAPALLHAFRSLFDQYRELGQATDPALLLPALIAQTYAIQELSRGAEPRVRQDLLMLGSRYAEYIGWLVQETGHDQAALWWTRRAVALATTADDHFLALYGLVRHALVTLYRDDAAQTIALAQAAQRGNAPPRILGLAAQREAQGHALMGDYNACMQSLDRARELLARHTSDPDVPVLGSTNLGNSTEMIKGWCLYDLGRPRLATEVLDAQLAQVPLQAQRTRVRYGTRRALAYAAAGDIDHACQLAAELLDSAFTLRSATIASDLRRLGRVLARHPRNASVRQLAPRLSTVLRVSTP